MNLTVVTHWISINTIDVSFTKTSTGFDSAHDKVVEGERNNNTSVSELDFNTSHVHFWIQLSEVQATHTWPGPIFIFRLEQ